MTLATSSFTERARRQPAAAPSPRPALLSIVTWPDPVIDALGHDPRSGYVEHFWLGILGPSTTWLLRRIAELAERHPDGFRLDKEDTARRLGLGGRSGKHAPFERALDRLVTFDLARPTGSGALAVRRRVPPLPRRHLVRLPASVQAEHTDQLNRATRGTPSEPAGIRARRLARSLVELGEEQLAVHRQLTEWGFDPVTVDDATSWACQQPDDRQ